ncbi:MAG: hypothetical protein K0U76_02775 [Actinomycetia bacterium]|nr:hypothetical protein [Actinomycetes bacterium]MCH9761858.1 hypothetical protein [Actinomycetes bacterium]
MTILPVAAVKKWLNDMVGSPRVDEFGSENAALLESARAAVKRVIASEAARSGWLGDVDFTADVEAIAARLRKAHELRKVIRELSVLSNPTPEDRKILAEAKTVAENLEGAAAERVNLIQMCAVEAEFIDKSLQNERKEVRDAEKRAILQAKLGAMLYGIESTPNLTPTDSAVDTVMSRVLAYRELKKQIQAI